MFDYVSAYICICIQLYNILAIDSNSLYKGFKFFLKFWLISYYTYTRESSGVTINVLNCEIVVFNFELQLRYYVHIRANIHGKGKNSLIPLAIG